ncbi:MAG: uroporphyrinogen-III C-methyltransferase [Candidatus Kapaibacteriales bacterium]
MKNKKGKVFIIGAGPGHPGLITVRGKEILQIADVILYDNFVSGKLLKLCPVTAQKIFVGKTAGRHYLSQNEINALLVQFANEKKIVVRLKGGDPFIFDRGSEEAQYLAESSIEFEIIPGITSAIGASAFAGIPLTHRGLVTNVIFLTAHEDPSKQFSQVNWEWVAKSRNSTIAIFMGAHNLPIVVSKLIEYGMDSNVPASAVQFATLPSQMVVCSELINLPNKVINAGLETPLLIIISPNIHFRNKLNWFEKKQLFGKKFIITRPVNQNENLSNLLLEEGAEAIPFELTETILKSDFCLGDLLKESYDWIIFTSENGVRYFFAKLGNEKLDIRAIGKSRIAVLGEKTARRLEEFHLTPDFVPSSYNSDCFLDEFLSTFELSNSKILRVKGNFVNDPILEKLSKICYKFDSVEVYEVICKGITDIEKEKIINSLPDGIIFTASSIVERFFKVFGKEISLEILNNIDVFAIGPKTQQKLISYGVQNVITSKIHTIEGIIDTLKERYGRDIK